MSPQIKKTAIGGSVAALTILLVLSAIAVAHRDARNMPADPIETNPAYATQEVKPLAIPPGMVNPMNIPRRFPHADVEAASDLQKFSLPSKPNVQLVSQTKISNASSAQVNPLRAAASVIDAESDISSAEEVSSSQEEAALESNFASSAIRPGNETPGEESVDLATSNDVQSSDYSEPIDAPEDDVALAGYDVPPSMPSTPAPNAATSSPQLMAPPMPQFGPSTQLPPTNAPNLAAPPSLATPPSFPSTSTATGSATLLPPTVNNAARGQAPAPLAMPSNVQLPSMAPSNSQPAPMSLPPSTGTLKTPPSAYPASISPGFAAPTNSQASNTSLSTPTDFRGSVPPPTASLRDSQEPMSGRIPAREVSREVSQVPINNDLTPIQRRTSELTGRTPSSEFISNRPGDRAFDGVQAPNIELVKEAPEEIQVGRPATFTLLVKNLSRNPVHDVIVQDVVPQGTKLQATNPTADVQADAQLVWKLGTIPAGGQQVLTVELIPQVEGEIGSVATVSFSAQSSVRTVATQPKLVVDQQMDPSVLIGESCRVHITVANEGTGMAYDVSLRAGVPAGLRHPQGDYLGLGLGDLAPGQSRTVDLDLEAADAGKHASIIRVIAANTEEIISESSIEVIAPKLQVSAEGPKLRYLERQATYKVTISNFGTASARNIELITYLPRGLRFNSAGNRGEYLPDQHAVVWMLEELSANTEASTDLVVMPVQEGDFVLRFLSRADKATAEPIEKQVRIEGQSELAFSVEDDNDPIEIDGQTTYIVRVTNLGTRQDSNVEIAIDMPDGATLVDMSSTVEYQQSQDKILFAPIPVLNPKDERVIRFTVALNREGVQIMRASLKSQLRPSPVVKEESTQVYSDQ